MAICKATDVPPSIPRKRWAWWRRTALRGHNGPRQKASQYWLAWARARDYSPRVTNPTPAVPAPALKQRCVLIVEDDDDSREMLGELVSAFGHRPIPASNAEEALAQAREQRPDVALIDIGLPVIDGCELARLLRVVMTEIPGLHTRLVALTGYSDGATRETAGAAGFDAYVVKPIMPEALEALLSA
jgi:CheY-like chemotaxis protein